MALPAWLPVVASFLAKGQEEKAQRDQMRQQLLAQYAQSLGGGGPQLQAAQFNAQQRESNSGFPNLFSLAQLTGMFGGDDKPGRYGMTTQAGYRGPGRVGGGGYAGRIGPGDF